MALQKARRATMLFDQGGLLSAPAMAPAVRRSLSEVGRQAFDKGKQAADVGRQAAGGLQQAGKLVASQALGHATELQREVSAGSVRLRATLSKHLQVGGRSSSSGTIGQALAGRTYACTDRAGRPGQLWVTPTHLCFVAARARIVIHVGRIATIELPHSRISWSRKRRALHLVLNGTVSGGVRRESFYGLFERSKVVGDVLRCGHTIGHTVNVKGAAAASHSADELV